MSSISISPASVTALLDAFDAAAIELEGVVSSRHDEFDDLRFVSNDADIAAIETNIARLSADHKVLAARLRGLRSLLESAEPTELAVALEPRKERELQQLRTSYVNLDDDDCELAIASMLDFAGQFFFSEHALIVFEELE